MDFEYDGERDDAGVPEGKGLARYPNGTTYNGQFKKGLPGGQGIFKYASGVRYEGQTERGARHGKGSLFWPSGCHYEGEFRFDQCHGAGVLIVGNIQYSGDFRCGKRCGKGKMLWKNGDVYEGFFENGFRHGLGTYTTQTPSGTLVYKGQWLHDKRWGKGRLDFANGDYYDGDWTKDKRHGYGTFFWSSSNTTYRGQFSDNQITGYGSISSPSPEDSLRVSFFEGFFLDGKRHGPFISSTLLPQPLLQQVQQHYNLHKFSPLVLEAIAPPVPADPEAEKSAEAALSANLKRLHDVVGFDQDFLASIPLLPPMEMTYDFPREYAFTREVWNNGVCVTSKEITIGSSLFSLLSFPPPSSPSLPFLLV